ncbi:hypothetical protein WJX72_010374 [[Myrmecia] bisecta]|uniref:SGNH hydrolase-type esterase domain-containing protein n=1 Tax=[Myrmecia] bisecta TaxID=41462 RepID=A0AAW1Q1Q1_9CHLO
MPVWDELFRQQVAEVQAADQQGTVDIIFYGDSIIEAWRGTEMGHFCPRCRGSDAVFQQYFASKYKALVMAISGDQTGHLLWRMMNGHLPVVHQPKVAVILIGTNDLGIAFYSDGEQAMMDTAKTITNRIMEMIQYISEHAPTTKVLLVGLLPRCDRDAFAWPHPLMKGLQAVNKQLARFETELWMLGNTITYAECGPPFIRGQVLDKDLLPDGLHPNAAGMALVAQCISQAIEPLLTEQSEA